MVEREGLKRLEDCGCHFERYWIELF